MKKFDLISDNGIFPMITSTDNYGNYLFRTIGNNIVSIDTNVAVYCPPNHHYNITSLPSHNNDFALQVVNGFNLKTTIPFGSITTGFMGDVWVSVKNIAYNNVNGQLYVILPAGVTFVDTLADHPDTIINNTLVYNFQSLGFNNPFWLQIFFIADSTLLPIDQLCFTAIATPVSSDIDSTNNTFTWCNYPSSSFDPNEMKVNPIGFIPNDTALNYSISFQNTGNASAHNISIIDTISNNLDLSTFSFIGASHPVQYQLLNGNIIRFTFYNIMLPDSGSDQIASHGYVSYSIRPKQNLANGTTIKNSAAIFFDFNAPVITNTTTNYIDSTLFAAVNNLNGKQQFSVYPNPFANIVNIRNENHQNEIFSFELFDVTGRVMISVINKIEATSVNLEKLNPGVYFYKILYENAFQKGKLIKY